jgi:hypothetical protein
MFVIQEQLRQLKERLYWQYMNSFISYKNSYMGCTGTAVPATGAITYYGYSGTAPLATGTLIVPVADTAVSEQPMLLFL